VSQTQPDRAETDAVGTDPDVVLIEDLGDRVVAADVQHDQVDVDTLGADELPARSCGRARHPALQDEHAVAAQMASSVLEPTAAWLSQ
jgi:hypothetical protein